MRDCYLHSASTGAGADIGIKVTDAAAFVGSNLHIEHFGSHGFSFDTSGGGHDDNSSLYNVRAAYNFGDGFHTVGSDSNAITFNDCQSVGNAGWGVSNAGAWNLFLMPVVAANTAGGYYENGYGNVYVAAYAETGNNVTIDSAANAVNSIWELTTSPTVTYTGSAITHIVRQLGYFSRLDANTLNVTLSQNATTLGNITNANAGGSAFSLFSIGANNSTRAMSLQYQNSIDTASLISGSSASGGINIIATHATAPVTIGVNSVNHMTMIPASTTFNHPVLLSGSVSNAAGGVVTTDGTQTLTNKTIGSLAPTTIANLDSRTTVFNDPAPVAGDDAIYTILNPVTAVHLTRVSCGVTGTTSVVMNLVSGGNSLIADMTATAGTVNQVVVTTWANGSSQCGGTSSCAIAAHTPVTLHIGTITGTPTNLACAVDYTVD